MNSIIGPLVNGENKTKNPKSIRRSYFILVIMFSNDVLM